LVVQKYLIKQNALAEMKN